MTQVTTRLIENLVEHIAKALVDNPDAVRVEAVEGLQVTILELRTGPQDLGKVIGRQGRIVNAVRTLLGAAGVKLHKRFRLEIVGDEIPSGAGQGSKSCLTPPTESPRSPRN